MIFMTFHPHDKAPLSALCERLHAYGMLAFYDLEQTFEDVHTVPHPMLILFAQEGMNWGVFLNYLEMLIDQKHIQYPIDIVFTTFSPTPRLYGLERFSAAVNKGELV